MKNIKNKFPELRYFIENPKGYEVLYYKEDSVYNEYPLDVEEAKEIIRTIDDLKQQLKKKDEIIDKAVEYINNLTYWYEHNDNIYSLEDKFTSELLQILEDKEVEC